MNSKPELDREVEALMQELQRCAPRNAQRAARARDAFLVEASQITRRESNLAPRRLNRWQARFGTFWFTIRKEKGRMFNYVMTVVLLFGAVLGGGATTVAAAQGAQPDGVLYPVKMWSEDIRLGTAANEQARLNLDLQFSARRAEEIRNGLTSGSGVTTALLTRYQNQLQEQLRLAAGLADDQITAALKQIRAQARQQEQTMAQLHLQDPSDIQMRDRVQTMLQSQQQIAQAGIDNPDWLRQQIRTRNQIRLATPTQSPTLEPQSPLGSGNPWTTDVPTPGSSYGPGTSQNPWTNATPVPGSGYGPGSGPTQNCTPQPGSGGSTGQGGSGSGGSPDGSGSGGKGGNGP